MQKDHRDIVLLVQSNPWRGSELAERLKEYFNDAYLVLRASSRGDAEGMLAATAEAGRRISVVISDEKLPDGSGRELLQAADGALPARGRLLLSAAAAPDSGGAPDGLRRGAGRTPAAPRLARRRRLLARGGGDALRFGVDRHRHGRRAR